MSAAVETDWSTFTVTEPSVVHGMPNAAYQRDPVAGGSLSCSGAKALLPPSCPALFKWQREHGRPDKRVFDVGHAAHDRVLGGGPPIVVVDAADWRTKAAKEAADVARASGAVPILKHEDAIVQEMADAIRAHPIASRLLSPDYGTVETSLFWRDAETGINCRARLDVLPNRRDGRMIVPDYKSTTNADPAEFANNARKFGYHLQHPFYCDGVRALDLADDVAFLFVNQEKTPPYLVSVTALKTESVEVGAQLVRRARRIYAECQQSGHWPGYSAEVEYVSLPYWYVQRLEEGYTA
jgi:hypothetical protein